MRLCDRADMEVVGREAGDVTAAGLSSPPPPSPSYSESSAAAGTVSRGALGGPPAPPTTVPKDTTGKRPRIIACALEVMPLSNCSREVAMKALYASFLALRARE